MTQRVFGIRGRLLRPAAQICLALALSGWIAGCVPDVQHASATCPAKLCAPATLYLFGAVGAVGYVWSYAVDQATGQLTPVPGSPVSSAGSTGFTAGTVNPAGTIVYAGEAGTGVFPYLVGPGGALTAVPSAFSEISGTANAIAVTPGGQFVYAANNALSNFSVFAEDGAGNLTAVPGSPFGFVGDPMGFTIHPNGRTLFQASVNTDAVTALALDTSGIPSAGPIFTASGPSVQSIAMDSAGIFVAAVDNVGGVANLDLMIYDSALGTLSAADTQVNLGCTFVGGVGQVVAMDPVGQFVYVNCPVDSQGFSWKVDRVGEVLNPTPAVFVPLPFNASGFVVSPNGAYLYATSVDSRVAAFAIDPVTGDTSLLPGFPIDVGGGAVLSAAAIH